jgi:UDP-N-acetylmuramyl tripeptide synthase
MKLTFTLAVAKMTAVLSKILRRGGGQALPGLLAERLDPDLVRKLASKIPHGIIIVTGTNGKTTTTKLITELLASSGELVLTNRSGSNLRRGVASALIDGSNLFGESKGTIGLFEVDEASLRRVAADLNPSHIVVLNLFRDQLDRYGELDTTASLIGEGISATKANIYLNADDPLVASLSKYAQSSEHVNYFGIEGLPASSSTAYETASDSDRCPLCNDRLIFDRIFYGHIGHYRCPRGHFNRPRPGVAIVSVQQADLLGTKFSVALAGKRSDVFFPLPGTYNLYNALAAISLAHGINLNQSEVVKVLSKTKAAFGRVEKVEVDGRILYLLLIKNPAGFTQVLETFLAAGDNLNILIAVNDFAADGRDVSWLWDVPVEMLAGRSLEIMTAGTRGLDMSLRLSYASLQARYEPALEMAIKTFIKRIPKGETGYVLPTYTAMIDIRKVLSKLTHMAKI